MPDPTLLPCPKCATPHPDRIALAGHLIKVHQADRVDAMIAARQIEVGLEEEARLTAADDAEAAPVPPPDTEATRPMPRPCGYCRTPGHNKKVCPKRLAEENGGATPARQKKPKLATRKKAPGPRSAPAPAAVGTTNGRDPLATIRTELDKLEAELTPARAVRKAFEAAFGPAR
jgi:hypothetical protein